MNPTDKQKQCAAYLYDNETTEILFGGGAGGGKSTIGCLWVVSCASYYPGTRWLIGRSHLKTLKETTLKTFFEVMAHLGLKNRRDYFYNKIESLITFANGSEVLLKDLFAYPSDVDFDSLGSLELTGAFVDEASQITERCFEVLKSRIRYRIDFYGLVPKILLTCNPSRNWLFTRFYLPWEKGELPEGLAFVQALPKDNNHLPESYLRNLESIKIKAIKDRLFLGSWYFDTDPSKIFDPIAVSELPKNVHINKKGTHVITVDVARFGRDRTVIIVWTGWNILKTEYYDTTTVPEVADRVKELAKMYHVRKQFIVVDDDGVGGGVTDLLNARPFVNNARPVKPGNYANLKTEAYFYLADMIHQNGVLLTDDRYMETIANELCEIRIENVENETKIRIETKERFKKRVGRSPDFADAMAMRALIDLSPGFSSVQFTRIKRK